MARVADYVVMRAIRYPEMFRQHAFEKLSPTELSEQDGRIIQAAYEPETELSSEDEAHAAWLYVRAMREPEIASEDFGVEMDRLILKLRWQAKQELDMDAQEPPNGRAPHWARE